MRFDELYRDKRVLIQFTGKDRLGFYETQEEEFSSMEEVAKFATRVFIGNIMDKISMARIGKRNSEDNNNDLLLKMYNEELERAKQELEKETVFFKEIIIDCDEFLKEENYSKDGIDELVDKIIEISRNKNNIGVYIRLREGQYTYCAPLENSGDLNVLRTIDEYRYCSMPTKQTLSRFIENNIFDGWLEIKIMFQLDFDNT